VIYVGFGYDAKSWLSRLIAWFSGGKISHTFFLICDPVFGWEVLGAEARGFYPMAADTWAPSYVVDLFAVPHLEDALAAQRKARGAPYDVGGLLGMTWVRAVWYFFKRHVGNPLTKPGAWFCSAIVAQALEAEGISLGDPRTNTPVMVRDALAMLGFARADFASVIETRPWAS
jgi:hypothetical protein